MAQPAFDVLSYNLYQRHNRYDADKTTLFTLHLRYSLLLQIT